MPFSVELYFDQTSEAQLNAVAEAVGPKFHLEGSLPHISLAVFETVDHTKFKERLSDFAKNLEPFEIHIASVGTFPGDEGVVFFAPVVDLKLLTTHSTFHQEFNDLLSQKWAYYEPGRWVPHISIGYGLSELEIDNAIKVCRSSNSFGTKNVARIGLLEFNPARKKYCFDFGG
ncbi:MAG: 2'-5' RNA ligase family protein [Bdellovibrionales bacterium]|nr:2'-5' RNA ligase family protein [Bdellovibrionales bacterium]